MSELAEARVLLIEGDILLAIQLAEELCILGAPPPIIVTSVERARDAARMADLAAAIVDPFLDRGDIGPVVLDLMARRIPILVTSLLPFEDQVEPLRTCSFVRKPHPLRALALRVADVINGATIRELHPRASVSS